MSDTKPSAFEDLLDTLIRAVRKDNSTYDWYTAQLAAARSALVSAHREMEAENAEARQTLVEAVDRDISVKDTLRSLAVVASNGIFWRSKEITSLRSRIAELEANALTAWEATLLLSVATTGDEWLIEAHPTNNTIIAKLRSISSPQQTLNENRRGG